VRPSASPKARSGAKPPENRTLSDHQDLLKIGEFAEHAGTNLRTLRYYEELGLLEPALRSDGGFRYYRPTDVHRVRLIHGLQELGLQLEQIGELLDTAGARPRKGESRRAAWIRRVGAALSAHRDLIDERIALLKSQRQQVERAQLKLSTCGSCDTSPGPENNSCEPCGHTGESLPAFLSALF
jgi:DNA-binding transcriptional MerR regulator